jgi:predicted Ser/Thr protein kinase
MKDIKAAAAAIQDTLGCVYPAEFLARYDQLERLAGGHGTETFLVQRKGDNQLYVAKCYDKGVYSAVHESGILRSLCHSGLPAYSDEFENDAMLCIVREYVVGKPLDRYRLENRLTKKAAVEICIQLCDILIYLHGQEAPVIHRDIKPQNIIVKSDETVSLIDFDASRIYHTDANTDTEFIGTRQYAPPEQYGFSQTDGRADIYAVGVVLGWLLTGEADAKKALQKLDDKRLAAVYKKCTAFSPEDRFTSAEKLKNALLHSDGRRKKAALRFSVVILSCLIFLCAGFSIGRYTDFLSNVLEPHAGIVFQEPMIEQAVRLQLGKTADEPITQEDLLSVTGLYIFGDSLIAASEEALHTEAQRLFDSNQMREGPIRSLADLSKMPNLKQVLISMQRITDISPLSGLSNLEVVDIKNNPVMDISPLGELKFLKRVTLFDTRVTDLSPLSLCPMLSELDAGKLPVQSPAAFEGLDGLRTLRLSETTLDTLAGIEAFTQIETFAVGDVIDGDLTPLLALPDLKAVSLGESLRNNAQALAEQTGFSISY